MCSLSRTRGRCDYRWRDVAIALERAGHPGRTAQACEHRFRLLVERERALRVEHLNRLVREPVVHSLRGDLLFRARHERHSERPSPRPLPLREQAKVAEERTMTAAQLAERAAHNDWKRAMMLKLMAECRAERLADTRSLTGRLMGDPMPGRSALDRRVALQRLASRCKKWRNNPVAPRSD